MTVLLPLALAALVSCGREGSSSGAAGETAWLLTLHGAGGGESVIGLDEQGGATVVVAGPRSVPAGVEMRDPRGLAALPDGTLLVATAWSDDPAILRFGSIDAQGRRPFVGTFADLGKEIAARVHPYAVVVAPDGTVFVSCQDGNIVTRYAGLDAPIAGAPIPAPAGTRANWIPPTPPRDGIFIGSIGEQRDGLRCVRGLAFDATGRLLVVDRDAPAVLAYDAATGRRVETVLDRSHGLKKPIQVLCDEAGRIFVSDREARSVFVREVDGTVKDLFEGRSSRPGLPSCLAIADDWLYLGDRKAKAILRLDLRTPGAEPEVFVGALPDPPEFLYADADHRSKASSGGNARGERTGSRSAGGDARERR